MKNNKISNFVKEKNMVIPMYIFKLRDRFDIDLECFMFLMFLYNTGNKILFDINGIALDYGIDLSKVMGYISLLQEKGIISIDVVKNDKNIREEYISLEFFYSKLSSYLVEDINSSDDKEEETIFDLIEKSFGRPLSPMEYEIVKAWPMNNHSEEVIEEAVKEAAYNGVSNLRYIDKILYEWGKKGYKTKEDVIKGRNAFKEEKAKTEVFDYDWMDDES